MGYVKVKYRKIFNELDYYSDFPKGWNNFIEKQEKLQNIIIKSSKGQCFCTNCKHNFISSKKVNEYAKCPNCNNKYLIKRSNLRYYEFKDYLSLLNIVNGKFVIRYFELKTIIDAEHQHNSSVVEFARELITDNYYREVFVNDRVSKCQCYIYIHHSNSNYFNPKRWREYTRNYSLIDYSIVFSNNLKKLLKDSAFKYSCIWDIAKNSTYIDLLELLKNKNDYTIHRIEMLAKMKLYNLSLKANEFSTSGSFQSIFGVSKDFYPFMRRNNITYRQLEILRLLQEKDMNKIKYLEKFTNYNGIYNLQEISDYISLNRFIKYARLHHSKIDASLYKDYLRFAKELGFDLKNNKYAFPKNLKEEHDKLEEQYEIQSKALLNKKIIKRSKKLSKNTFKNNKFIVYPADTLKALQDESKQQNNCVRTYAEKYASGICDIYFMRDINNKKKSLVTVEVRHQKIIQSRIKNNYRPNEKQLKFLQKWEDNILQKVE